MRKVKPTHRLKVLDKATNAKGEVGAGWLNSDGSISIVLNHCVVIAQKDNRVITLFPALER